MTVDVTYIEVANNGPTVSVTTDGTDITVDTVENTIVLANEVVTLEVGGDVNINGGTAGSFLSMTAGAAVSALRVVRANGAGEAVYADHATGYDGVVGITTTAVSMGALVTIQYGEALSDGSWAWTPGQPIFLGVNGVLTATAPSSGAVVRVGRAVSATKIIVEIEQPIVLL